MVVLWWVPQGMSADPTTSACLLTVEGLGSELGVSALRLIVANPEVSLE